ncbi:type VI secretion system baseplate subunit TssF [Loktanella sp. D2R18]|uniref:type VI secretion system baseplate subunit TssF n=1 Tax=Rhodobacterales TaxID=204455 RepID=UPI000DE9E1C5|nr:MULTISPECIES: type VI secretion system baseplate subunit TssF [Rhodobacterales]MDO6590544.1 type VI secretion system baseplate subunit TssF [Yoonia sp. 1_MG-2023]RBW41261.1 type VI secretion system baseplate subunit TssF [Loktanella sp. D2R18]
MDTRILKHYEQELSFIRDMGGEFATAFPKIAGRLGMEQLEVLDPYVERMLEGFAFLAARVQLELDQQYPVFTQNLLEIVYPHFLAPVPSMMIARLTADATQGNLKDGYTLPRGTQLRGQVREGEQTACIFTTAHDATLWPIEVAEAEYIDGRSDLVVAGLAKHSPAKAAIRLRLRRTDGAPLSELPLDRLTMFLSGTAAQPWRLYEAIMGQGIGLAGRSTDRRADWVQYLGDAIHPRGFDPAEALLPTPGQSFDGYRLLQEYFAMPQRFFFFDLDGLGPAIRHTADDTVDLYILLREGDPQLKSVNADSFDLGAVPAINLFHKRCDRTHVTGTEVDHLITVDRTAPLDFEIYQLESVTGISAEGEDDVAFRPFYSAQDFTPLGETHQAYYSQRRRMRQRSEKQRLKGTRTSYLGSEMYVSLTDRKQAPYPSDIKQLAVTAMCTNRDMPMLTAVGTQDTDFTLPEGGPISRIRAIVPPTKPRPRLAEGHQAWQLISQLSLNYLSIADADRGKAAAALREVISLYAPSGDPGLSKQVEGLSSVVSRPIVRRMMEDSLSTAVRGIEIKVGFDESYFEGSGCYLLGAVLEAFFAKYVTINSFTETAIHSQQRGDIRRWPARSGRRILI